jgi:hypothetical protein
MLALRLGEVLDELRRLGWVVEGVDPDPEVERPTPFATATSKYEWERWRIKAILRTTSMRWSRAT